MKAIRRLNNNVVICLTAKGKEVIARGKGIGFHEMPYDVPLANIEKTYYDVSDDYIGIIEGMDDRYLELAGNIVDYFQRHVDNTLNGNIVITLADHLRFAVERFQKGMRISLPILYDIEYLYPREIEVGRYALKKIRLIFRQKLPDEEAAMIAMHFVNAQAMKKQKEEDAEKKSLEDITMIVEKEYGLTIDKDGFNYMRFVTHLNYLLQRGKTNEMIQSDNLGLYDGLKKETPKAYLASEKVSAYLSDKLGINLTDEEKMYLIMHINRVCSREETDREA